MVAYTFGTSQIVSPIILRSVNSLAIVGFLYHAFYQNTEKGFYYQCEEKRLSLPLFWNNHS